MDKNDLVVGRKYYVRATGDDGKLIAEVYVQTLLAVTETGAVMGKHRELWFEPFDAILAPALIQEEPKPKRWWWQ